MSSHLGFFLYKMGYSTVQCAVCSVLPVTGTLNHIILTKFWFLILAFQKHIASIRLYKITQSMDIQSSTKKSVKTKEDKKKNTKKNKKKTRKTKKSKSLTKKSKKNQEQPRTERTDKQTSKQPRILISRQCPQFVGLCKNTLRQYVFEGLK